MTVISTANPSVETASIIAEFGGQATQSVDLMIGIGSVKDSEAVYFQYVGEKQTVALMDQAGKPVSRIGQVQLTGLTIVDDVYADTGFSGSKLNVLLETQRGSTVMLTSGLVTIWSQCLMTCLMGLFEMYSALTEARSDKDKAKTDALMRDAVEMINTALSVPTSTTVIQAVVVEEAKDF